MSKTLLEALPPSAPIAIDHALRVRGVTTRAKQAEALGLSREHWTRYVMGHQSPTAGKLAAWLASACEAGHTFHLTLDPHIGWVCREAQ